MNTPPCAAILIRQAGPTDHAVVTSFNRALAEESEGKTLDERIVSAGVRTALSDPSRGAYYLAERDGAVVGQTMITAEWSDWRCAWFWWIQSVYVAPAHRRHGVFRALHQYIRDEARARGDVCGLRLYAHHANENALRTYERLGMERCDYILLEEDWSGRV